jgi:hypothetical protein
MLRLVIEAVSLRAVEIPQRETLVRVAWKSGAVTELHVARPTVSQIVSTPASALARLRELGVSSWAVKGLPPVISKLDLEKPDVAVEKCSAKDAERIAANRRLRAPRRCPRRSARWPSCGS